MKITIYTNDPYALAKAIRKSLDSGGDAPCSPKKRKRCGRDGWCRIGCKKYIVEIKEAK